MNRAKLFIMGITLLIVMASIACGAKPTEAPPTQIQAPTPPPVTTEPEKPNFTMYTDESGLFSISYPADWEQTTSEVPIGQKAPEAINRLKSGLPIEEFSVIFMAEEPGDGEYAPYVNIGLEPVPPGVSTANQMVDSDLAAGRNNFADFQVLSRTKATVDGREAVIFDWKATVREDKYPLYSYQMYMLTDQAAWTVTCGTDPEIYTQWKNDFDTIVKSLRISD